MPTRTDLSDLQEAAEQALGQAHAPYSRLRVGAALRSASGQIYRGCNVENAAFPLGSCAEGNAIAAAVLAEGPSMRIADIVICARDFAGLAVTIPPCGGCRQRILEFSQDTQVHFATAEGGLRSFTLSALLPESFRFEPES